MIHLDKSGKAFFAHCLPKRQDPIFLVPLPADLLGLGTPAGAYRPAGVNAKGVGICSRVHGHALYRRQYGQSGRG